MLPPYASYKHKKGKYNDSNDKFKSLNLKLKSKRHTMQTCTRVHKYLVSYPLFLRAHRSQHPSVNLTNTKWTLSSKKGK